MNLTEFSRSKTLLWFRPDSPLKYELPSLLAALPWGKTVHIPSDTLTANAPTTDEFQYLFSSDIWFLSSPTAAYCAAKLLKNEFWLALDLSHISLAVIGQSTLQTWFDAGGFNPKNTVRSTRPDSMGLLEALKNYHQVSVLRAQTGRPDLIQALKIHGVSVRPVKVYEKVPNPQFKVLLNQALKQSLSPVLFFSSTEQISRVLASPGAVFDANTGHSIAAYPRISQSLKDFGIKHVYLQDAVKNTLVPVV